MLLPTQFHFSHSAMCLVHDWGFGPPSINNDQKKKEKKKLLSRKPCLHQKKKVMSKKKLPTGIHLLLSRDTITKDSQACAYRDVF